MENGKKIFCIIPAFNEEKTIATTVRGVKSAVDAVVVVDDGSGDKTSSSAAAEGVVVLRHLINRGQGAALETGNEYALANGADIIVHFDADGQFLPAEIGRLIKPIADGECDVIFGSRFKNASQKMPWTKRKIIFPVARFFNRVFFKVRLGDPQCGFRALNAVAAKKIVIKNDGSAHCSEILHKVFKYNFRTKEVPVTVIYHEFGQNLFGGKGRKTGGVRILADLFLEKLLS